MNANEQPLLKISDLQIQFVGRTETVYAVNNLSISVKRGEILGIVGESGCGKSVSMLSILGLMPSQHGRIANGSAMFMDRDLIKMSQEELTSIRGREIGFVFQDPIVSFNPVYTIGNQLMEPLISHGLMNKKDAFKRACEMLEMVGITNAEERMKAYPHQFSGGMRQRVMIAMALICSPDLLIADEPTTALDVTIEAQIVELVKQLQKQLNNSIIWITHDLSLLAGMADRVAVMYGGQVIETASVYELYRNPTHPYTIGLLNSLPKINESYRRLEPIDGIPPVLKKFPSACSFANRCSHSCEQCQKGNPVLKDIGNSHYVACWDC